MDEVRWRGEGSEVDGYTRVDLKLARDFAIKGSQAQVALIVHNITGEDYNEFRVPSTYGRDGNAFDRRAYVQLSIQFD
jgi:pantothenate kinase